MRVVTFNGKSGIPVAVDEQGVQTLSDREVSGLSIDAYLQKRGNEGWELTAQFSPSSTAFYQLVFKREMESDK